MDTKLIRTYLFLSIYAIKIFISASNTWASNPIFKDFVFIKQHKANLYVLVCIYIIFSTYYGKVFRSLYGHWTIFNELTKLITHRDLNSNSHKHFWTGLGFTVGRFYKMGIPKNCVWTFAATGSIHYFPGKIHDMNTYFWRNLYKTAELLA